ncbi:MAG: DUF5606 domain-containing protein [Chitinophagales bacterium]|nr:DUF5606 domain-containing protein [Chitinophagales bacterium]MDW8419682.1 DUF5606 domain-containing protein [Chitinophagales bacterium]
MTLADIVAITNLPGLYKVVHRRADGLIATSLIDNKTQFIPGRTHLFTQLDGITMYTTGDPVPLKDVLASIKKNENNCPPPDGKDDEALKKWLEVVLPNYDREKVYVSDMRKLCKWYHVLNNKNLIEELIAENNETDSAHEKAEAHTDARKETPPAADIKAKVKKESGGKAGTKPAVTTKKVTTPRKAQ